MRVVRSLLPCLGAAFLGLSGAACTEAVDLSWESFPAPWAVPSFSAGNGQDGPRVVSSSATLATCRALLASTAGDLLLSNANGVGTGSRLLLLQMQDLFAVSGQSGPLSSTGQAGEGALVSVASVAGSRVTVTPPVGGFSSLGARHAQACLVPQYTDLTITAGATLRPAPWNGSSGGVLALMANGAVLLDGSLDASGAGFRGGAVSGNGGGNTESQLDCSPGNSGGGKGEGLDGSSFSLSCRGNYATGAGGGMDFNAGGGGGAGGGAGGFGGCETAEVAGSPHPITRGDPGAAPLASLLLAAGGGGGGGQQNESAGGAGGAGGGLVVFWTSSLGGSGSILADGSPGGASASDGAGGGGGGGTVVIHAFSSFFSGTLGARGGAGGNIRGISGNTGVGREGPGGGGGGGLLLLDWPSGPQPDLSGGPNGVQLMYLSSDWGSTPGSAGVIATAPGSWP